MRINDLNDFYLGFEHFFPEGKPVSNESYLKWKSRQEFIDDIKELTDIDIPSGGDAKLIKESQIILADLARKGEEQVESNLPGGDLRETQAASMEKREAERTQTIEQSDETVRTAIDQKIKNYQEKIAKAEAAKARLEKKEVYAKVEAGNLSSDQENEIEASRSRAKVNPRGEAERISQEIREKLGDSVSKDEADLTAINIVANLQTGYAPIIQSAVTQSLVKNPQKAGEKDISDWASVLSDQSKSLQELTREIAEKAYGKEFQEAVLPSKVEVSDLPQAGYTAVPLGYISEKSSELITKQREVFENPFLKETDYSSSWIGSQLEGLEGNGSLVQGSFSSFRSGGVASWEGGSQDRLDAATGASEPVNAIGGLVKGGVKRAVGKSATKAAISFLSKAGAPETLGLSLIADKIGNWFVDHANWKTLRKLSLFLTSLPVIGAGIVFGIPLLILGGGAMGIAGLGMAAGITSSMYGAALASLFSAIGGATLGAIGIPILTTLLVFPVVVAFILFIINSGAYVVPLTNQSSLYASFKVSADVTCSPDKKYCFPVAPLDAATYPCGHHDYPAADIFRKGDKPGKGDDKPVTIVAYTAGTVTWTTTNDSLGGISIMITGDDGRFYYYAHNERNLVQAGMHVSAGQPIALMDSTGNAAFTQEHVHFGISKKNDFITQQCGEGVVSPYCKSPTEFQNTIRAFVLPSGEFSERLGISCPH